MLRLILAASCVLAGCSAPQFVRCNVRCSLAGDCPRGYVCGADDFCHTDSEESCVPGGDDDASPVDDDATPPADAGIPGINCDEMFTGASGTVSSPNPYPHNFVHAWCIFPGGGPSTTLSFTSFSTEASLDLVSVYDADGDLVSTTSGTTAPAPATSTAFAITMTTDGSVASTGFTASWAP